ncbi:hypothetical protein Holit_02957 [Hollandina sp. SP2]
MLGLLEEVHHLADFVITRAGNMLGQIPLGKAFEQFKSMEYGFHHQASEHDPHTDGEDHTAYHDDCRHGGDVFTLRRVLRGG